MAFNNVAVRDPDWKRVHPSGFGAQKMPTDMPLELYGADADPTAKTNLTRTHPDMVKRLSAA